MNHPPDSERAISDVFGAVILIGVIVTVFAVAGVMMFSQPQPQKIPALNALISTNAQTIDIHHGGGDAFNFADIQILVDGTPKTSSFKLEGTNDWSTWSVGQSLICTSCDPTGVIQIVFTGGSVSQVIAQAGEDRTGTMGTLPVPAPVVTAITPNTAPVGNVVSITDIAGSGFFNGATVKLSRAGSTDLTASNVVVVSATKITCDFNLIGSTPGGVAWDVVVTNPSGPSGTLANAFTMTAALAPVADFTGTPTSGTVPLTVTFTDASTNFPDSWFWQFGDGNTSSAQNPVYTYQITGTYTVNLTATNDIGSSKRVRTNYITVIPIVIYTINATAVPPGGSISPSGMVSVVAGNSQNFTISANTGYSIADILVNNASVGAVPSYEFTNVAANHTITATFAINQYTINATSGPNGTVTPAGLTLVNYGANQAYNITPSTGYHVAGVLVNNESVGAVTNYTFTNIAANQTISATFAINQYTITPSIIGGNGVISPDTVQTVDYGSTPTFNFTPALNYRLLNITVNSILVSPTGNNSYTFPPVTENKTIVGRFLIDPPVANFTGTPRSGAIPLSVIFNDTSTNSPTSWLWNFGDGNYSSLQNPINTYVAAGNYSVRLEATNAGGTNVSVKNGYIFTYVPAVANFTGTPTSGPVSLTVLFTDLSTGSPSSWFWRFGSNATVNTSTNQNPGHTYDTVGRYSVNLTVANAYSSSYLLRENYINATVAPPVAAIYNATSNIGLAPLTVEFWDMSSNDPTSWLWHFDDGSSDVTTQDATHTFTNPGTYNVSLTATNAGGSSTDYMIVTAIQRPTVTSVAPATGSTSGGNTVTIIGTNLLGASVATFGGTGATGVSVINATAVSAITPAHAQGIVTVNVTTPNGTATGPNVFTYAPPPTVTSVAPSTGTKLGGTSVTILGTNLIGATAATFDGLSATGVSVINATAINAITPAHASGVVSVNVTTPNGTATGTNLYTYNPSPTVTSVSPAKGPIAGGTVVTIFGTNLMGATAATFDGLSGTSVSVINATAVRATTPAHAAGWVNVNVTTPNGTSTTADKAYRYFEIKSFTTLGTQSWVVPTNVDYVEYLVIAGGGGGGRYGGGGGAGGVLNGTITGLSGSQTVVVGANGTGAQTVAAGGVSGGNSQFATIIATGGGGGGSSTTTVSIASGKTGGSGGGGSRLIGLGGSGIVGQGGNGGRGSSPTTTRFNGGGGGGAGGAGTAATSTRGGNGGAGITSDLSGTSTQYAGGGGGGVNGNYAVGTVSFGGGAGGDNSAGSVATSYGGGGGGGGSNNPGGTTFAGGNGRQGIVIIMFY